MPEKVTLIQGDCLETLATLEENSLDSCVTDPPYHLTSIVKRFGDPNAKPARPFGKSTMQDKTWVDPQAKQFVRLTKGFMGKQWDGGDIAFRPELWAAVYRVLKPGAHLLAFGGTRTYHRMACAIEDAGFEIRDQIQWLYGSGFPKSHDVSKGIDRAAGAEREIVGINPTFREMQDGASAYNLSRNPNLTAPATDAARQWQGWGTALKPANEPILLARKPLSEKNVAANVLKWGTGAINIDGCRIESEIETGWGGKAGGGTWNEETCGLRKEGDPRPVNGRWPANVIHDGSEEVVTGFPETKSGTLNPGHIRGDSNTAWSGGGGVIEGYYGNDQGSAARFFYSAKADSDDRIGSKHPTVKPVDLMQYLVRLITPKGGTVLDPFAGTGTTGEAALYEGMLAVLIEREADYFADAQRRIKLAQTAGPEERRRQSIKAKNAGKPQDNGPLFAQDWEEMWKKPFDRPELVWGNK